MSFLANAKQIHVYKGQKNLSSAHKEWQELRQNNYQDTIEIIIHEGTHYLNQSLIFDERVSDAKTLIRSARGESATISEARKIED